uniref:Uncharacterized protein n=1 Tax=Oryza rufipogon TaxID=4529 RepID=A0A0E0PIK7_ORYRU
MAPTLPSARRTSAPPTANRCHPWRRRGRARRSSPWLLTPRSSPSSSPSAFSPIASLVQLLLPSREALPL